MKTVAQLFVESDVSEYDLVPAMGRHDFGPGANGPHAEILRQQQEMLKKPFLKAA
jgi:hypothetical protein